MRLALSLAVVAAAVGALLAHRADRVGWTAAGTVAARGDVPQVTTAALARRLAAPDPPTLLDARAPAEYAVSHLPGARHLPPDTEEFAALADLPRETPLVTYCSVGYRSAAMARRLRAAGFTHVENLEGSIFAWANEGRPVFRAGTEVHEVHPYDALWGRLLTPELRAGATGGGS